MRHTILRTASAVLALSVSPTAILAQQASPPPAQVDICRELVTFLDRRGTAQPPSPVTLDQARGFQRANNVVACRDGAVRIQSAGITLPAALVAVVQTPAIQANAADAGSIVVQQPAPRVQVQQASPTVSLQQPAPQVTVNQATPEILVRQPQPTVTVDIPQPEIIVRMPRPDVNVAMAQPQVQVNQPPPQVQLIRPEQPQVRVEPAQPNVVVRPPANAEANVQVQREVQPTVRYERAEPRVIVNQAKGEPQVRVEQMAEAQPAPAAARPAPAGNTRMLAVSALENMDVYNARGNEIGDVEDVLIGPNDQIQLVVAYGGFLGVGERRVSMPLNHFQVRKDRLVVTGPTDEQLKALPAFTSPPSGYRSAEASFQAPVAVAAAEAPATTGAIAPTSPNPAAPPATRATSVSNVMGKELYNMRGAQLGDVERVLMGENNKMFVVIGHDGILRLGEKQILLPMEQIQMREDGRLVISGLTDDEIKAIPEFNYGADRNAYREVGRDARAEITLAR